MRTLLAAFLSLACATASAQVGTYHGPLWGPPTNGYLAFASTNTHAMAALNTGWAARFTAIDTRDVKTVYVHWNSVSSPGEVTVRIETIDATTGKPSGTLYDANASLAFTPTAGWQALTFASIPTTGLTAGSEYAIVLLTTTGGTTQTLSRSVPSPCYPSITLTASDGTTRSNFAEVNTHRPICTLIMDDDEEEILAFQPYVTVDQSKDIYGTNAAGMKFVVPAGTTKTFTAYQWFGSRTGTPAGDLRFRILDSDDAAVAGTTVTVDKDSLTNVNARDAMIPLVGGPVTLAAGTYRAVLDSVSSANSSNCWTVIGANVRVAGNTPSGFVMTDTADVTAGPPITWTDTTTMAPLLWLVESTEAGTGGDQQDVLDAIAALDAKVGDPDVDLATDIEANATAIAALPQTGDLADDDTIAATTSAKLQTDMQADPTDFHVNVLEIGGTAQTANDNGADINEIYTATVGYTATWDLISTQVNEMETVGVQVTLVNADAILASSIAADVTTELQSGLATAANQTTILTNIADVPTVAEFNARTIASASYALEATSQSILTDTAEIGVAGEGLTAISLDAADIRTALGMASADLDTQLDAILADTAEIGAAGAGLTAVDDATLTAIAALDIEATVYTKDSASKSRTWNFTRNSERVTSPNTITEAAAFNGEVCFDLSNVLNPGAGILSITSVSVSPSSGVTVGTPAKTSDNQKAIVNVSGHTAGTTYTYTITVSTTDGDTALVRKGTFVAE